MARSLRKLSKDNPARACHQVTEVRAHRLGNHSWIFDAPELLLGRLFQGGR
jgi:hypothetical protein